MMETLPIGGIVPFTATDYPGHLSMVVFCQGCPWRCLYCHNPHLQPLSTNEEAPWTWEKIVQFLKKRIKLLDAIVFSGGEPTLHKGLIPAMQEAKKLGFKIGLHTGGHYPKKLKLILPHVDWVGLDIKAPFEKYETITKIPKSGENAKESARLILQRGVEVEFRTTVHPDLLTPSDLIAIGKTLNEMGASTFVLQEFRKDGCNNTDLIGSSNPSSITSDVERVLKPLFHTFFVR